MRTDGYDLAILGGGPGGYSTAFFSHNLGLRPVVIEKGLVGGTCLHRGCIPAKTWLHTAATYAAASEAEAFGVLASDVVVDWQLASARKKTVVSSLHRGLERTFRQREIPIVNGIGRVTAPGRIEVATDEGVCIVEADAIVVATGSRPQEVPGFDFDGRRIVSSDDALDWENRPERVTIVGGGAIGCEFASLLSDLGSQVTIIEMMDQLVPGLEPEVASELQRSLRRRGVQVHLGATAGRPEIIDAGVLVDVAGATIESDVVLVAVGRRPNTDTSGLEELGVEMERGYVKVDPLTMETSVPGLFAVGDVVAGTPQLAHVGFAEGLAVAELLATGEPAPVAYDAIPLVVYTRPEVAQVGLTEQAARESGVEVTTHRRPYGGGGRAVIKGEKRGLVKLVVSESNRLVGASVIGPDAGELIHELMITLGTESHVGDVGRLIHAHPTLSETVGDALLAAAGLGLH
jgi:dihydrolipoamide dehydrogenase